MNNIYRRFHYNISRSFILRSMVINSYLPVLSLWMWH